MKIYTKAGDRGRTSLFNGKQVRKDHPLLEAYGTVDELISYLGLIADLTEDQLFTDSLVEIQDQLMKGASLLSAGEAGERISTLPSVTPENIETLEQKIDQMESMLTPLKNFIIPGGDSLSSHCHIARTICRRAERNVVHAGVSQPDIDRFLQYLNRLSDFLFVAARWQLKKNNGTEKHWKSNT